MDVTWVTLICTGKGHSSFHVLKDTIGQTKGCMEQLHHWGELPGFKYLGSCAVAKTSSDKSKNSMRTLKRLTFLILLSFILYLHCIGRLQHLTIGKADFSVEGEGCVRQD